MHFYSRMNYFGGSGLEPFGYLRVIKIQNIFIKELVKDVKGTILLGLRMMVGDGVILKMIKKGWQNHIFRSYSQLQTQLIWGQFWTQWIG